MADINWLGVIIRFAHIFGAIIAVGGAIFAAFVVFPAAHVVPEESRAHFNEMIRKGFARLVMIAITLLLVTGFYNYLVVELPLHKGQAIYNATMGVKILLAFAVFFFASALTGKSAAFEGLRKKRKRWLTLNILFALAVVALGAFLRAVPDIAKSMN